MNWPDVHPKLRALVLAMMYTQRKQLAMAVSYAEDEALLVAWEAAISLLEDSGTLRQSADSTGERVLPDT